VRTIQARHFAIRVGISDPSADDGSTLDAALSNRSHYPGTVFDSRPMQRFFRDRSSEITEMMDFDVDDESCE